MNPAYWSVQGEVFQQANASKHSDVGKFFTYNVTSEDHCWGLNPSAGDGVFAQGSWGSDGEFAGIESALATYGSASYADYLVDSMASSWTSLGIQGFTLDVSANYDRASPECPNGMLQIPDGDSLKQWSAIADRVRALQPQVVFSGEYYTSWDEVMRGNADIGGQGYQEYHDAFQSAIFDGDLSTLENIASTSGSDAASVLCYLHPFYDGKQPGECPTMYFRDVGAVIDDLDQHTMWVAAEAANGIVSEHDYDPNSWCTDSFNGCDSYGQGAWWNVTQDPYNDFAESPLWAFSRFRALNRLALRTKLSVTGSNSATSESGGALALLKHDSLGPYGDVAILVFNPGAAQNITIDLSLLPPEYLDGTIYPYDLLKNVSATEEIAPLTSLWSLEMDSGDMKFFSGFSLGVWAPRLGKKENCSPDEGFSQKASATTLQGCFLECLNHDECENVYVEYLEVGWMASPSGLQCTLLGAIADPDTACAPGTGTLVHHLEARSCAHRWEEGGGESAPPALGFREAVVPSSPNCPKR